MPDVEHDKDWAHTPHRQPISSGMGLQEVQVDSDEFDAIEQCLRSAEKASISGSKRKLPLGPLPVNPTPPLSAASTAAEAAPLAQCSAAWEPVPWNAPAAASASGSTARRVPASLLRPQPALWGLSTGQQPYLGSSTPLTNTHAATLPHHTVARQASGPASTSGRSSCQADLGLKQLQYHGQIVYASTAAEVDAACAQLLQPNGPRVVGLDIEWCARYIRGQAPDPTALLQICYCCGDGRMGDAQPMADGRGSTCLLLHVRHTGMTQQLKELLLRQDIFKVGVGIRGDAIKMHGDFGFQPEALLELSDEANKRVLAAVSQVTASTETRRWSLADLTAEVLRFSMNKSQGLRVSDWDRRPLPLHQQQYAACDAFASLALHWALQACPLRKPNHSS